MTRFIIALPLVAACSTEKVSAGEARHTFESLNRVTSDLLIQAFDSVVNGNSATLKVDTSGSDYKVSGSLKPTSWKGDVLVDGRVSSDKNELGYTLSMTFDQVVMDGGPTLDGGVDVEFWADDSINLSNLSWNGGLAVDGGIDLSGTDRGAADLVYDLDVSIEGPLVKVKGEGDISGHDVSDWDEILTLVF
ncbi:MAG: hypothetical protein ABMA64_11920 [Myxococcota bacterium]